MTKAEFVQMIARMKTKEELDADGDEFTKDDNVTILNCLIQDARDFLVVEDQPADSLPKIPPSWQTTLRLLGIACRRGDWREQDFAQDELSRLGNAIDCKDATREDKT